MLITFRGHPKKYLINRLVLPIKEIVLKFNCLDKEKILFIIYLFVNRYVLENQNAPI